MISAYHRIDWKIKEIIEAFEIDINDCKKRFLIEFIRNISNHEARPLIKALLDFMH